MPIGRALDKKTTIEELIEKVKALPEMDRFGEYEHSMVRRDEVIRLLEEDKNND